jgi:phosphoribosylglycinamide formyltransferase 1
LKRIVVFASGSGSNFQSIIDAIAKGELSAQCVGLICDREGIGAIDKARRVHIPVYVHRRKDYQDFENYFLALFADLNALKPDLIVLAGYLSKIPSGIVEHWAGKIINIHPALLPKFGGKGFYGLFVHEAVLKASETQSGCTVHYVDEVYDHGSIIEQSVVPVIPGDTPESLQARVLEQEHIIYPKVIQQLLTT